jgi:hypothetical protein
MDENNTNVELEEESLEMVDEVAPAMDKDELTKAVEDQMNKLRTQAMLLGAQTICRVVLQKIYAANAKPGKKTYRDYERLIKDLQQFCETGISRNVNEDGTTSPVTEEAAE